jgi:hypothetical protein
LELRSTIIRRVAVVQRATPGWEQGPERRVPKNGIFGTHDVIRMKERLSKRHY